MVLSCEADERKTKTLQEIIEKFSKHEITFYRQPTPAGESIFYDLQRGLESSRYIFVFIDEGSGEDRWLEFQKDAALSALMRSIHDHSQYIVPIKARSHTPMPWFLHMYHVLELSTLLKGKFIEAVDVERLTEDDVNISVIERIVSAVCSNEEKLVYLSIILHLFNSKLRSVGIVKAREDPAISYFHFSPHNCQALSLPSCQ